MEEDRHRRLPRVHNAYAHVCKSFQVAIERSKSALVHLWQVLPYIIASLCFAAAFILSCHNAIVLLTPMLFVQLLGCCISCCVFVGLCCYFRCWFQSGFIALVGHMSLLCFAVDSAVSFPIVNNGWLQFIVRFAILEGLLWFVQNIPSIVVVDWTRQEYRSDNVGYPVRKIYKLLVLVVPMLSFGRRLSINRRDLGCILSRLPSQNKSTTGSLHSQRFLVFCRRRGWSLFVFVKNLVVIIFDMCNRILIDVNPPSFF